MTSFYPTTAPRQSSYSSPSEPVFDPAPCLSNAFIVVRAIPSLTTTSSALLASTLRSTGFAECHTRSPAVRPPFLAS